MYCWNCGKQIPNESKFCSYCGTKVTLSPDISVIPAVPVASASKQQTSTSEKTNPYEGQERNNTSTKESIWERLLWRKEGIGLYILIAVVGIAVLFALATFTTHATGSTTTPASASTRTPTPTPVHTLSPKPAPLNGQILRKPSYEPICPFRVSADSENYYYIYLDYQCASARSVDDRGEPTSSISFTIDDIAFFVRPGETVEIDVPVGVYKLYYACGDTWYGQKDLFGEETVYSTSDELLEFYTDQTTAYGITLELWAQYGGDFETKYISASQFPG